ncbi:2-C-methyl-D-erythritol 4-phosphate cytidylyltransferase [Methylophaga frappieri]|uniref:2-C-methyl-D-erythritol 4-phosphate cytidylyltransferase n=1 Tax=Methylophaga frappieri (strain ATCC BAA-2434 / DSM 25690 / JAM7) TaxID=754477 RepID=I1YEX3_METFJ|nr:2-C-methyl-D-erythritol 4-phosphate cytidylyltransferase [Methylophaga frappieri]AFJ01466.1 2-C-methyl-D-erythritol 4-phosphate cytidylyltransferase [Methylophaga frappieri]
MSKSVWAVVPAAGNGSRMRADRPKQYLPLLGKPVIRHTLERLISHPKIQGVIVAVAEQDPFWSDLMLPDDWPVYLATGGSQRSDSVFNALFYLRQLTDDDPWVLVHDAARPCLRHTDIDRMLTQLAEDPVGGILGIPMTETVKRVNDNHRILETVNRDNLWRAATPQMFHLKHLLQALQQTIDAQCQVTDEASAMEYAGFQPKMVEGHADNLKITLPQDLELAALYLQRQGDQLA